MGLKAGWLALFMGVWIIGIFLGSTFDFANAGTSQGVSYSTGTATFTNGSSVVTSGGGAVWTTAMEDGVIMANADNKWFKIKHVGGGYIANVSGQITGSPLTLAVGANAVTVTQLGTLQIYLPPGNTGTAASGVCTVEGGPIALVAGVNTINTIGIVGGITVTIVGSTVIMLYNVYNETGGAGLAYTIAPSAGWAGTGTGGYTDEPRAELERMMSAQEAIQRNPIIGTISVIVNPNMWSVSYKIVLWQWSFLYDEDGEMGTYGLFYWIFLFPFVAMGMLSIFLLTYGIITGNISWG